MTGIGFTRKESSSLFNMLCPKSKDFQCLQYRFYGTEYDSLTPIYRMAHKVCCAIVFTALGPVSYGNPKDKKGKVIAEAFDSKRWQCYAPIPDILRPQ